MGFFFHLLLMGIICAQTCKQVLTNLMLHYLPSAWQSIILSHSSQRPPSIRSSPLEGSGRRRPYLRAPMLRDSEQFRALAGHIHGACPMFSANRADAIDYFVTNFGDIGDLNKIHLEWLSAHIMTGFSMSYPIYYLTGVAYHQPYKASLSP